LARNSLACLAEQCVSNLVDLRRKITEQTDLRDDCGRAGNDLVVREEAAGFEFEFNLCAITV
jgi:hypothetical protein